MNERTGFDYDDRGNPTTYYGNTCTYDVFNRATSLGTALTNGYRSDGLRAWKEDASDNKTYYYYDGNSPLCEMDSSGNWKGEFLYGPAGLISHSRIVSSSISTVFFAYDERGNVQSVVDGSGSLVSSRVYDAYGAQVGGSVVSATYDDPEVGYKGQCGYFTDSETGLVLCGHRYYDPAAGRWLNRDPIGYAGGINVYAYCANDPVMGADTSGFDVGWADGPGGPDSYWNGGGCGGAPDSTPTSDQISQMFGGGGEYSGLTGDPNEDNALNAAAGYTANMPLPGGEEGEGSGEFGAGSDLSFMEGTGTQPTQKNISAAVVNGYRQGIANGTPFWEDPGYSNDPIDVSGSGWVGDGHHRLVAGQLEGGLPPGVINTVPDNRVVNPPRPWSTVKVVP